ncbi:major facilitator superfamily domain-containing protein 3 [Hyalella azteca]|uniref:Major facilitator superfamily domain-containing protein 3 n=1 Tax=Hyalella azteca TaxID=294128 RepID=A0A8B7P6Y1_HYAAZ|nr:major facilitator superfamily domain-containing protein 3 [Hyalella azteca]
MDYAKRVKPSSTLGKFAALGWLYLVQGIPYGLQDKFIPLQLRARGLNYSSVGAVKAVLVPWVTKGLWAPALQLYGNRRRWLLAALLLLAAASFAGSLCDAAEDLPAVVVVLLTLNAACAVQDVVVDGLALVWLQDSHLGLVNSMQVVLYKVGSLCGGGGLLLLLPLTSWRTCLLLLAGVYVVTALWVLILPSQLGQKYLKPKEINLEHDDFSPKVEARGEKSQYVSKDTAKKRISSNFRKDALVSCIDGKFSECSEVEVENQSFLSILRAVFSADGSTWLALYVALYKMAERGTFNNFPLLLLDKNVSMVELSFWNGLVSQMLSILGSVYGGIALSKPSADCSSMLSSHSLQRLGLTLLQSYCVYALPSSIEPNSLLFYTCIFSLCYLSFTTGVISTLTFTLMMRYSKRLQEELQATHYSVFASVEVAGKLVFATTAGYLVDVFGVQSAFLLFSILSAVPVVLLVFEPRCRTSEKIKR